VREERIKISKNLWLSHKGIGWVTLLIAPFNFYDIESIHFLNFFITIKVGEKGLDVLNYKIKIFKKLKNFFSFFFQKFILNENLKSSEQKNFTDSLRSQKNHQ